MGSDVAEVVMVVVELPSRAPHQHARQQLIKVRAEFPCRDLKAAISSRCHLLARQRTWTSTLDGSSVTIANGGGAASCGGGRDPVEADGG